MTVKTSKGKTFAIDWMYPQRGVTERLMIGLHDDRPLTEIIADFGGCERFHRESTEEGNMDFTGYTVPIIVSRPDYGADSGYVTVTLSRPQRS